MCCAYSLIILINYQSIVSNVKENTQASIQADTAVPLDSPRLLDAIGSSTAEVCCTTTKTKGGYSHFKPSSRSSASWRQIDSSSRDFLKQQAAINCRGLLHNSKTCRPMIEKTVRQQWPRQYSHTKCNQILSNVNN